jgi:hypothetical protein
VIAERLGVQPSSPSFHLAQLVHADLITQRYLSRQLIYSVSGSGVSMTALGQEERFAPPSLKDCCAFREETFAGTHANERDAPKAGIKPSVLFVRGDHLFGSRPDRAR